MNLPYNLEILPGVMQDTKGRKFVYGRYPSGKQVMVPYEESQDAQPARMIPVPQPKPRTNGKLHTTGVDKVPFKPFIPKRLGIVEWRCKGCSQINKLVGSNAFMQGAVDAIRQIEVNNGSQEKPNWQVVQKALADWFVQYHRDEEQT